MSQAYYGIDVSYCQQKVDWQRVKAAGNRFVMVRAGFCYNNGAVKEDRMLRAHLEGAQRAGLETGVYLYSYALDRQAGQRAAVETAQLLQPWKLSFPVAFDIEDPSLAGQGRDKLTDSCLGFCEEMERLGYYSMVYANRSWLENLLDTKRLERFDLWLAEWGERPGYGGRYGIWQFAGESGRVDGVSGSCDRDLCYRDYPEIIRKAGLNGWGGEQSWEQRYLEEKAHREKAESKLAEIGKLLDS